MATEYGLELDDSASTEHVAETLSNTAVAAGLTANPRLEDARLDSGLLVLASPTSPLPFPDPVEQKFGFAPKVNVLFRLDSQADGARQRRDMIQLAVTLLKQNEGDALLAFGGEIPLLLRKNGQLTLSDRDDFWPADLLELVPRPYERANLPVV